MFQIATCDVQHITCYNCSSDDY